MSHCAQQIRDWFVTALTGVSGLPAAREGIPRQVAAGTTACVVTSTGEAVARATIDDPAIDQRDLNVQVIVIAGSLDAADALCLKAEEALAAAASFPGKNFEPVQREYQENIDTDRDYVSVTVTYTATYFAARNDLETFK